MHLCSNEVCYIAVVFEFRKELIVILVVQAPELDGKEKTLASGEQGLQ